MSSTIAFRLMITILLFQFISLNSQGQTDLKMPTQSFDTIAISKSGLFNYQNQMISKYKELKPLLYQYPESKALYDKVKKTKITTSALFSTCALNLVALHAINTLRRVAFEVDRDISSVLGSDTPQKPKDAFNLVSAIPPTIFGSLAIYSATKINKLEKASIEEFNALVKKQFQDELSTN